MIKFLVSAAFVILLTACGGSSDGDESASASSALSSAISSNTAISSSAASLSSVAHLSSVASSLNLSSSSRGFSSESSSLSSGVGSESSSTSSQPSSSSSASQGVIKTQPDQLYGMYVSTGANREEGLLGDAEKEAALLRFIRDNGFNYLIFYDLWSLDVNSDKATQLASLIRRAKTEYGIYQVAAALGRAQDAEIVVAYNTAHTHDERIDVLNLEYEFWNQTDRAAAFTHAVATLQSFKAVAMAHNLETETYIGWITAEEGAQLGNAADRILVHFYRPHDVEIIYYGIERLAYLGAANDTVRILPIFSNEGPTNTADIPFMGTWLETHPNQQAFASWMAGYNGLTGAWKSNINIAGATWFLYQHFQDVNVGLGSHISEHPEDQAVCLGETVTLTVSSSATNKDYCWMRNNDYNGQCLEDSDRIFGTRTAALQLSNIASENIGSYYVRVISYDSDNPTSFASRDASVSLDANCPAL